MATIARQSELPADRWLFSARVDLAAFLGSAIVSVLALAVGAYAGVLKGETPDWAWVPAILLVDVAHVYSTLFRVYFDTGEIRRRPLLYLAVPICGLLFGVALYSEGELLFWRVLAYMAVFHFVRQQYGWVALYRAKLREPAGWEKHIDTATIYLATIYPLVYWHGHLPRNFWWFLENDFRGIPTLLASILAPVYWTTLSAYAAKAVYVTRKGRANPGKDIVVVTTAVCWYVGIITFNSDYSFTVTNVIIHGVPYLVLVYWYMRQQVARRERPHSAFRTVVLLMATVWLFAYAEELIWDRAVWQERAWLFGGSIDVGNLETYLVPLLAVPQLTHYVLDGFIWKRKHNPNFELIGGNTNKR
ncbi:MAG: hypothetical protein CMJ78_04575 [Planctomycetaceae bacterium]|nr:hypothetical protein [Planctomycetaceae bacterium]